MSSASALERYHARVKIRERKLKELDARVNEALLAALVHGMRLITKVSGYDGMGGQTVYFDRIVRKGEADDDGIVSGDDYVIVKRNGQTYACQTSLSHHELMIDEKQP